MKRYIILFSLMFFGAGFSAVAQEEHTLTDEQIQAMEERVETISDPAARLFFQANIYRAKGDPERALRALARLIAIYPYEKRWITRSELLCSKLYMQLDMLDAADVTARQVAFLNQGTPAADEARLFREKIEQMKERSADPDERSENGGTNEKD